MLNVALVGLMAGSLLTSSVNGDDDKDKKKDAQAADEARVEAEAPAGIFARSTVEESGLRSITQDTYAFGAPSDAAPIKIWVSYAYGESNERWDASGDDAPYQNLPLFGGAGNTSITTQRGNVGAQLNLINFPAFKLGGGAVLSIAKNELNFENGTGGALTLPAGETEIATDFELQNVKVFGTLRGRVLGIHGGYIFDIASEADPIAGTVPVPDGMGGVTQVEFADVQRAQGVAEEDLARFEVSDGRDAIFFGADFDASGPVFRAFGGIDYFLLEEDTTDDNEDYVNFLLGAGVKLSIFEIGAAAQITTRLGGPLVSPSVGTTPGVGGHAGTIAPYLRISPSGLPASIFVKGAVQDEYFDYGYAIGGANSAKPKIGFTAGLSVGFE